MNVTRISIIYVFALLVFVQVQVLAQQDLDRVNAAVLKVNAKSKIYQPRNADNADGNETFCNWFVADVASVLGFSPNAIPTYESEKYPKNHPTRAGENKPKSANELNAYFLAQSKLEKGAWKALTEEADAVKSAKAGSFVVASTTGTRHGHIAILLPKSTMSEIRVAQAGSTTGNDLSLTEGFGKSKVKFFVYSGK